MSVNGDAGGDPLRVGLPVVDMVTDLNAVIGILLALQERQRSGQGQLVDAALYDSAISLLHPHAPNWFMDGKQPQRTGNAHPIFIPMTSCKQALSLCFLPLATIASSVCCAITLAAVD